MQLPIFKDTNTFFQMMQAKWASILNPVLANPLVSSNILANVTIKTGTNSIPHLLQRPLQGWFIVGIDGPATIYDQQKSNQTPALTLKLVSSADCVVQLAVF